jgi:[ribosomal protein S5]-alanine N-acetyltransferase
MLVKRILETERLYFREFTLQDAVCLYEMHRDPAITKYTGDPIPWDSVALVEHILAEAILPQYKNNIGRWAVHLKENDTFIGWCGLKDIGAEVDLGYRFIQKYWGNGYATEAASAVLEWGIRQGFQNLVGRADLENKASVKVLSRIGFSYSEFYTEETTQRPSIRFVYQSPESL